MTNYHRWGKKVERVYLSHRPATSGAEAAEQKIADYASSQGIDVVRISPNGPRDVGKSSSDENAIIISLGGDGTLLHTRMQICNNSIPLISVNYGGLGALSELEPNELDEWLPKILSGDFFVEERSLLSPSLGKTVLNEVVLKSTEVGKSSFLTLRVDGQYLFRARADGIILATPTGSSAYAFSAGGPLVDPSLAAMIVVPIAPFFWGIRPFVIGNSEVRISTQGESTLVLDGEKFSDKVKELRVRISSETAKFIRLKPFSFPALYRKLESRLV